MIGKSKKSVPVVPNFCGTYRALAEGKMANFPCSGCKKECFSELLGTYTLVFTGPASIILTTLLLGPQTLETLSFVALSFGGTVAVLILVLGKYSGAIINPALTLAAKTAGSLKEGLLLPYLFFQTTGGILAGLTLRLMLGSIDPGTSLGSTKLASGLSPTVGFLLETAGAFTLASSALLASVQIKSARGRALLVGGTLFVLIVLIGPFTGAGFNPARSLGPSLASGYLDNLGVYLSGPLLGASVAGLVFRACRRW